MKDVAGWLNLELELEKVVLRDGLACLICGCETLGLLIVVIAFDLLENTGVDCFAAILGDEERKLLLCVFPLKLDDAGLEDILLEAGAALTGLDTEELLTLPLP